MHDLDTNSSKNQFLQLIQHIQVAITSANLDKTAAFHKRMDGGFANVKHNLRRKKLH